MTKLPLKLAACAAFALFTLSAVPAFAHDPVDPGDQQAQCTSQGGTFAADDDPNSYDCDLGDSTWVCDFSSPEAACSLDFAEADVDTNPGADADDGDTDD